MTEISSLGEMKIEHIKEEFGEIYTAEIVVTNERIRHIKERHPEDFELFEKYGEDCIKNPDIIIKDSKHDNTIFMIKKHEDINLNLVVRIVLGQEKSKLKNSVMTFYRIREKNLKKLLKKCVVLYEKT